MPLVAELITKLEADTNNFNKGINDSHNKLSKFAGSAAKAGAAIALAVGTVAVGGFIKLLSVINDTEERISNLVDTSERLNTSIGGLQKLEFIARLSGGGINTVTDGMAKLTKTITEVKDNTESFKDVFGSLGVTLEDVNNKKLDEVYLKVLEGISKIPDQAERARVALEIFGRSGLSQLNLVKSDIQGLSKEFESFGGVLTGEQASAVDSYGDSLTKLSALFDTFKIQLTAAVAPALEEIVNFIINTTKEMGGLGPVANITAQYFVAGLQSIVSGAQRVIDVIEAINYGFKAAQLQVLEFMQAFNTLKFEVSGGEFDFERSLQISKLQKELRDTQLVGSRVTDPLQSGLQKVQGSLQANSAQKINVNITTEKGLKAEVAESPEVTSQINRLIEKYAEASN